MDISRLETSGGGDSSPPNRNNSRLTFQQRCKKFELFFIFVFALIALVYQSVQAYSQFIACIPPAKTSTVTTSKKRHLSNPCLDQLAASLCLMFFTLMNSMFGEYFVCRSDKVACKGFFGMCLIIFLSCLVIFGYQHTLGPDADMPSMALLASSCLIFFCAFILHFVTSQPGIYPCNQLLQILARFCTSGGAEEAEHPSHIFNPENLGSSVEKEPPPLEESHSEEEEEENAV